MRGLWTKLYTVGKPAREGLWPPLGPGAPPLPPMCSRFAHCFCNSRQSSPPPQQSPEAGTPEPRGGGSLRCLFWLVLLTPSPSDLIKGTIKHGLTVEDIIMTGINYLDSRSNFWRQQKPIYARERDRKLMQEKWLRNRKRRPSQTARYILKNLEDIDMRGSCSQRDGACVGGREQRSSLRPWLPWAVDGVGAGGCSAQPPRCPTSTSCCRFPVLTSGSAEGSLQKAEKVLKKVLEWNKEEVPNKDELVGNLYSCIGNAQIELGQMVAALQSHRRDLEIAKE